MPRSSERGAASLAEVLVAIAIVGIAFAGILGGFTNLIFGTKLHRDRSEAQLVLTSAADVLRSDLVAFGGCDATAADYQTDLRGTFPTVDLPSGWSTSDLFVLDVRLWDGESFVAATSATRDDCDAAGGLLDLQLLTVEVESPDGRTSESTVVVKA